MSRLRDSARGQQCLIRIPGVCNWNPETTCLCHFNGGGMGIKMDDMEGAFGCSDCHAAVDGKPTVKHGFSLIEIKLMFLEAGIRTRDYWRKNGFIKAV
ncbi:MAG: nuclease domain-containing protein [Methylobacter sp.]